MYRLYKCVSVFQSKCDKMGAQGVGARGTKRERSRKMKANVTAMRQKDGGDLSGISYGPRGRAVDKSPSPRGSRRGGVFKVSLVFLGLIQKKWFN